MELSICQRQWLYYTTLHLGIGRMRFGCECVSLGKVCSFFFFFLFFFVVSFAIYSLFSLQGASYIAYRYFYTDSWGDVS